MSALEARMVISDDNPILKYPSKVLRKKSTNVEAMNQEISDLLDYMADVMYDHNGIGLAAPQIGVLKNIIVIDTRKPEHLYKIINPKFVWKSKKIIDSTEGCLSIPGVHCEIQRHAKVTIEYFDEEFQKQSLKADDLLAICIQHEIDHLSGRLYIDHLSKFKKMKIIKEYKGHDKQTEHQEVGDC